MRRRCLLPFLLALACPVPASAATWSVEVADFAFTPQERTIELGDTVTWNFHDGGHTTTAKPGQGEQWDSGNQAGGSSYQHTFTRPGRYEYVCTPHASIMSGVVEVGGDPVADTVDGFRSKRRGRSVTIRFTLNEPARVTYRLRGPSRRTITRARLAAGAHRFRLRRLRPGSYRGTLILRDDFDNRVTPRNFFVIR